MAIGIGAKFNELFNVDDAADQVVASRLALHEVLPGSLSADSKYSTNELNKKRRSVTGRESRVGQIRSAYTMDERQEVASEGRQPAPVMEDPRYTDLNARQGGTSEGYESAGAGGGAAYGGGAEGGGPVSDAVVGDLLSSAGMTALGTGGLLTGLGVSPMDAIGPSIGVGMQSLTGLGALNTLAGGIAGHYTGQAAVDDLSAAEQETGKFSQQQIEDARRSAGVDAMSGGGLVGMGVEGLLSMLGNATGLFDYDSPLEQAQRGGEQYLSDQYHQSQDMNLNEDLINEAIQSGNLMGRQSAMVGKPGVIGPEMAFAGEKPSFLSGLFEAPTQQELKDTFNMETLQSISGGQMGVSGGAKADDIVDGQKRGSLFGGSPDINEPAAPDAGALTDTPSNVQDTTASVVTDTPADVAPSQPKGIESGIDTEAQKEAALNNSIQSARESLMSSKGSRQHKEMGFQMSADTRAKLAELNALERQAGMPLTTVTGVRVDPWSGTSTLQTGVQRTSNNFGVAPAQYGNVGWGTNFGAIQSDWDAINAEIMGAGGNNFGGGWTNLGGGVQGDFSGERDSSGNAISG